MNRITNKVIVITGASGGLGKEIALQAARRGAQLVLIARNREKLLRVKKEIEAFSEQAVHIYVCDVADMEAVGRTFSDIHQEIGEIDVLVNNAGFGRFEDALELDLPESKAMIDVNVLGVISCTKMVLPEMVKRKQGHIINIASQAGKIATPKSSVYAATKHAVLGFSNALRLEMAEHAIYVTTVNPGPIATDFFDIADLSGDYVKNVGKYMLKPDFVAEKVVGCMLTNKREINLPGWMHAGSRFFAVFPRTFEALGQKFFFKK